MAAISYLIYLCRDCWPGVASKEDANKGGESNQSSVKSSSKIKANIKRGDITQAWVDTISECSRQSKDSGQIRIMDTESSRVSRSSVTSKSKKRPAGKKNASLSTKIGTDWTANMSAREKAQLERALKSRTNSMEMAISLADARSQAMSKNCSRNSSVISANDHRAVSPNALREVNLQPSVLIEENGSSFA